MTDRRKGPDSAFWRGDYTEFWVYLGVFIGLSIALAVLFEFSHGLVAWIAMGAGLIIAWLATVIILIPRSARSYRDQE